MKIAIHNPFMGLQVAESELAKRIGLAANNLGWESIEVGLPKEIEMFSPDFVLVMHFNTPKLTGFPTYGCMWNPPAFFRQYEIAMETSGIKKNILSYDAYLSSSEEIRLWLEDTLINSNKKFFNIPFYTSCNQNQYLSPNFDNLQLVYIGSNWDGSRFKELFEQLDQMTFVRVYGAPKGWSYLNQSYKGLLPFDGKSVLKTLRESGVGLCLHKEEHTKSGIPSMRIFEIISSGAVAICGEHPFIRETFGDLVLYIRPDLNTTEKTEQISEHMSWIQKNKQQAFEMTKEAHKIFLQKYTLEKLLIDILPYHKELAQLKGFGLSNTKDSLCKRDQPNDFKRNEKKVQMIVMISDSKSEKLEQTLDSIANQTYQNIGVILVKYKELADINRILASYSARMTIRTVESKYTGFRSTQLKDGINTIDSDYFAILDEGDMIHSNHISLLVSLLEINDCADVAYSGSVDNSINMDGKIKHNIDYSKLLYYEIFDIRKLVNFNNFISPNSFVAKSSLVSEIFQEDPQLDILDTYFLILHICKKSNIVFSYEVTCQFGWRGASINYHPLKYSVDVSRESAKVSSVKWQEEANRVKRALWDLDFTDSAVGLGNNLAIRKSKKFYQLRYNRLERFTMNTRSGLPLPIFISLKLIYLKLSGGGKLNHSPNLMAKLLIFIKSLIIR